MGPHSQCYVSRGCAQVVGMDVRAVIIVGGADGEKERIAGVPIAFLDVLGRPVVERMIEHLQQQSVSTIAVVGDVNGRLTSTRCQGATLVQAADSMLWRAAETAF